MKSVLPEKTFDRSRFARAAEKYCLAVQSVVAVTTVVVGIKIGKVLADFYTDNPHLALSTIYSSWLVRLLVLLGSAYLAGRLFWPQWKWRGFFAPLLLLVAVKIVLALVRWDSITASLWLIEARDQLWLVAQIGLYVLRSDLKFLAGFAAITWLAVPVLGSYLLGRVLWRVLVGLLLLISGIELACYCKMRIVGSGHLLAYFLTNAVSLWPVLRSGLDLISISGLLAPMVAGSLTAWLISRRYARRASNPARSMARAWLVLALVFIGAEFVPAIPVDHNYDRFVADTYFSFGDLIPFRGSTQLEAARRASRMPPLFDTTKAFVSVRDNPPAIARNVIIIMLESARASATSVGDPKLHNTPFLAEFAKRGAVVPEMYAVIPRTPAAWVAVLNGIWPSTDEEMATWAQDREPQLKSLPKLLATHGYNSAFFTSGHLSFSYDAPLIKNEQFGEVFDADSLSQQGFEPSFWGFEDRIMLEPSLSWVKNQRDKRNPFLLVMMTTVGHYDYRCPASWPMQSFSTNDSSYNRYLNCLSYVDSMVKGLIEGFDKLGVLRSSIVVILGDHGESFGEHGPRIHSLGVYDETLRIPAIIYADGLIAPGTTIPGLRQEVDILPTILDGLGLEAENAIFPGTSLFKAVAPDRTLFFSSSIYSHALGMRKDGMKYIYNFGRTPTEAYAISHDPAEEHDIAETLPRSVIDQVEMDMLVWHERVSRVFTGPMAEVPFERQLWSSAHGKTTSRHEAK